jgi:hypothetical protein
MYLIWASALDEYDWSISSSGFFNHHWIRGWVDPGVGLDALEKRKMLPMPGIELLPSSLQPVSKEIELSWVPFTREVWVNDVYKERYAVFNKSQKQTNSVALVRERTVSTERPPLVGEVSANFCG